MPAEQYGERLPDITTRPTILCNVRRNYVEDLLRGELLMQQRRMASSNCISLCGLP